MFEQKKYDRIYFIDVSLPQALELQFCTKAKSFSDKLSPFKWSGKARFDISQSCAGRYCNT